MSRREVVFALLAIGGLVAPWYFNIRYVAAGGSFVDVGAALRLAFANPISSSLSADAFIAFATFAIWAVLEARRIGMRGGWMYVATGFLVSFAFAFPLFLLGRERHLRLARS